MTCSLHLCEKARPIFVRHRDVPHALRENVEKELDTLESTGIITKVDHSDWGSPLYQKLTAQYTYVLTSRRQLTPRITSAHYPIRKISDILSELRGSSHFCRLDLFKAYLNVQMDPESAKIQTISTHQALNK